MKFNYTWRRKNESGCTRHPGTIEADSVEDAEAKIKQEWGGHHCDAGGLRVIVDITPDESANQA